MKIVYCIACTCHSGGMERVLANKANYLARHGYEIVIVTTDQRGEKPFFALDDSIRCIDLGINYDDNNGKSFFNKLLHFPIKQYSHKRRLKKTLLHSRPDVTVCMFNNDANIITHINDGSAKVLEIHFSRFKRLQYGREGVWGLADAYRSKQDEKTVRRFDKFVVLTEEDKGYWGDLNNIEVIPNAISHRAHQVSTLEKTKAIAVGRYTYQKGFDLLIDAWKIVADHFPEWTLDIIGDGPLRSSLQDKISSYGLDDKISLVKATHSIEEEYIKASVFVLSSRYEGLPMVLLEAQSFGLPIVAFECKCGPRDVVTDGKDGYLVDTGNLKGLAQRLMALMSDTALRKQMGAAAKKASVRYNEEPIMEKWIDLFQTVVNK